MSSSEETRERLLKECAGFDFVRFTFADVHGIGKCKSVPRRHLLKYLPDGPQIWEGAIAMGPRSQIPAVLPYAYGNIAIRPQPGTFHALPWAADGKFKVGEFLCENSLLDKPGQQGASTRTIARRQVEALATLGYTVYSGYEAEFMLLSEDWSVLWDEYDFATTNRLSQLEALLYDMDRLLAESGIDVETYQTEYSVGQVEMVLAPKHGMDSPDQMFNFKQAAREIVRRQKLNATFMSKPYPTVGNGQHFSHSIWKDGENAFFDDSRDDNLSDFAKHWIAGLLKHSPALSFLGSPTVNCYRRMHAPWAPDSINWGIDDRFASIRVKNTGKAGTYIENRFSGGSANPYLIFAATIAAGLDGVKNKLECPPAAWVDDVKEKVPYTVHEGHAAFKADDVMVNALGQEFVDWFSSLKEQTEFDPLKDIDISKNLESDFARERDAYLKNM